MMQDLQGYQYVTSPGLFMIRETYWNPTWEWATRRAQKTASKVGFMDPAAKGAIVTGINATETILALALALSFRVQRPCKG